MKLSIVAGIGLGFSALAGAWSSTWWGALNGLVFFALLAWNLGWGIIVNRTVVDNQKPLVTMRKMFFLLLPLSAAFFGAFLPTLWWIFNVANATHPTLPTVTMAMPLVALSLGICLPRGLFSRP